MTAPVEGISGRPVSVACVVLAHDDPSHVLRLRAALDPFEVFLHCDERTSTEDFATMSEGLPAAALLPRRRCAWGAFDLVEAELDGYRRVLAHSDATHLIVMSGADYPLVSTASITTYLESVGERSVARFWSMPFAAWGRSGGLSRLRYRHWAWRKHMLRLPVPRHLPEGLVPSGGSVWKILTRRHVEAVLRVVDERPDLVAFWRRTWCADETFVATLLRSPLSGVDWQAESVGGEAWWIGWDGTPRKSPPWLGAEHFDRLEAASRQAGGRIAPALFARKVSSTTSSVLLDRVDAELRVDADRSASDWAHARVRSLERVLG